MKSINWIRLGVFYLIAVSCSFVFRIYPPEWYNNLKLPGGLTILKHLFEGSGPFLGYIVITWFFKSTDENSTFGTSKWKSLVMCLIPVCLFAFIGIDNPAGINSHYYGALVGLVAMIYVYMEELGWRGYLQYELREIKPVYKNFIIGTLWYLWHLTFLGGNNNILSNLIFWGILVAGSWGIGKIVDQTRSILAGACFHLIGSIMSYNQLIIFNSTEKWIVLIICLICWIYFVSNWNKKLPALK